jgi:hypothetical protein
MVSSILGEAVNAVTPATSESLYAAESYCQRQGQHQGEMTGDHQFGQRQCVPSTGAAAMAKELCSTSGP